MKIRIVASSSILFSSCSAFVPSRFTASNVQHPPAFLTKPLYMSEGGEPTEKESKLTEEELEQVGNLVADEEWMGLTTELAELVRVAVLEDVKKNTRDFTGNEDYKIGDVSKVRLHLNTPNNLIVHIKSSRR